ncbi:unnamed protein product, partial [marine sediment metagenome]
ELYFKGAVAQGSIGTTFNLMLTSLVGIRDKVNAKKITETEAADAYSEIYTTFGASLDMFAQGIKKNIKMPELAVLREMAKRHIGYNSEDNHLDTFIARSGNAMKAAHVYLANRSTEAISILINRVWKTTVPTKLPVKGVTMLRQTTNITDAEKGIITGWVMKDYVPASSRDDSFIGFKCMSPVTWHIGLSKLVDGIVGKSYIDIKAALLSDEESEENDKLLAKYIDAYAFAAYKIKSVQYQGRDTDDMKTNEFLTDILGARLKA